MSNRGIGEKTVRFTVRPAAWQVTFQGTDTESFAIVRNTFTADITDLKITARDKVLSGTGALHLSGTLTSGVCSGPFDKVAAISVKGELVGTGPEALLRIQLTVRGPGGVVRMACTPAGGAEIGAEGPAERFGEALGTFDLPAAGGMITVTEEASIGGVTQVTIKGTFRVALARP